jgi:uncharacterized protein (TIGR03435 family)
MAGVMARVFAVIAILGSAAMPAAQSPATPPLPTFEVASIKATAADSPVSRPGAFFPGGRFVAQNASLRMIIHRAYPEYTNQSGRIIGPQWIDRERFDIETKAQGDPPRSQVLLMLRHLLADRFKLRVRTEMRPGNGYVLVHARADRRLGPELRKAATTCASLSEAPATVNRRNLPQCSMQIAAANGLSTASIRGGTISTLRTLLQIWTGQAVEDRTGLSGPFDIDLEWSANEALLAAAGTDLHPSIFTSVQDQLGLKLEPSGTLVEVLVIDSVERPRPD